MKVLMYGWEFPPHISGGLGMACFGIVSELAKKGVNISLVLPKTIEDIVNNDKVTILGCENYSFQAESSLLEMLNDLDIQKIETLLHPYITEEKYLQEFSHYTDFHQHFSEHYKNVTLSGKYGHNLFAEVAQYAFAAGAIAKFTSHDLIHAHDWLTVLAGIEAKRYSNKPLIFQVQALETDRSGTNINHKVFEIEKYGLEQADRIISVSQYTKNMIVKHYGIIPEKITVVHNGIYYTDIEHQPEPAKKTQSHKMVLFLGRITHQKGPSFFLEIAKKILDVRKDVQFVVAGSGNLLTEMIEHTAGCGIGKHVHFTGFLNQETVSRIYRLADVYVMPSVSEPFGLSCLEALSHNIPVVISKQSGVSEVVNNVFKADFWDSCKMAEKILALLDYRSLQDEMIKQSKEELKKLTWENTAEKLIAAYNDVIN